MIDGVVVHPRESMKLPTIKSARPLARHQVEVIWSTCRIDKVYVGAALKAHRSLAPALKKPRFVAVAPGEWGHCLSWGGREGHEIEIGADAVWRMAHGARTGGKCRGGRFHRMARRARALVDRGRAQSGPVAQSGGVLRIWRETGAACGGAGIEGIRRKIGLNQPHNRQPPLSSAPTWADVWP